MDKPTWFFISLVELQNLPVDLTERFHELCSRQEGVTTHGWRLVSSSLKRYLFFCNCSVPLSQDAVFDLSMCLQTSGEVISESTNSIYPPEEPLFEVVYIIDSGVRLIGRDPEIDLFLGLLDETIYKVTFLDGVMTVSYKNADLLEVITAKKHIEVLARSSKRFKIITYFINWK